MKYSSSSRPIRMTPGSTRNWYIILGAITTMVLMALWMSAQLAERGQIEQTGTTTTTMNTRIIDATTKSGGAPSTTFVLSQERQELADRILEMNAMAPSRPSGSSSIPSGMQRDRDGGLSMKATKEETSFGFDAVPRLDPPKLQQHDYDESEPDGPADCPRVEAIDTELPNFFGATKIKEKYLPHVPTIYEPRAPKALWFPPIPISKDENSPMFFHMDETSGVSTTKVVYNLLGTSARPKEKEAPSDLQLTNLQVSAADFAPRSILHQDFLPPLQPTCPQHQVRQIAYWQAWSKQQLSEKPLNVLVWHGTWERTTREAQHGGPMGELGFFTSTMLALTALSAKVTFLTHPQGEEAMKRALQRYEEYDIILIDTYSSEVLEKGGYLKNPDVLCRLRSLDCWGTPAHQNSWKLPSLYQYLVLFACKLDHTSPNALLFSHRFKNVRDGMVEEEFHPSRAMRERDQAEREREDSLSLTALSFSAARATWPSDHKAFEPTANLHPKGTAWDLIEGSRDHTPAGIQAAEAGLGKMDIPSQFRRGELSFTSSNSRVYPKKFQILIWGKEGRYFQGLTSLLRALAEIVPLLTVVKSDGKQYFPDVRDLPRDKDGNERIRHLGIITQDQMKQIQMESALLLGIGDPLNSFTPMESLLVGTPFLNPNFTPHKTYRMNSDCVVTSQLPYAERLGAPQTWNYPIGDIEATKLVVRTALKWVRETQAKLGGIPSLYPKELTFPNLVKRLNQNLRTDFCEESGRQKTPAHRSG